MWNVLNFNILFNYNLKIANNKLGNSRNSWNFSNKESPQSLKKKHASKIFILEPRGTINFEARALATIPGRKTVVIYYYGGTRRVTPVAERSMAFPVSGNGAGENSPGGLHRAGCKRGTSFSLQFTRSIRGIRCEWCHVVYTI